MHRVLISVSLLAVSVRISSAFTAFNFLPGYNKRLPLSHRDASCAFTQRSAVSGSIKMSERGGQTGEWNKYAQAALEQPLSSKRQPEGPLAEDPLLPTVEDIIMAADDRKAQKIWAARVAHLTYSTEFFINVQGTSRPMLQAISANIEDLMQKKYSRPIKWQGTPDSGWILLDYGDVIVNVMTPAAREYYDLETLWRNGEPVPFDHIVKTQSTIEEASPGADDEEQWGSYDPFSKWDTSDAINIRDLGLTGSEKALLNDELESKPKH